MRKRDKDWIVRGIHSPRMERIEAFFGGYGYSPHRHDTFAIGMTLSGVHGFRYRGTMRHSLPGGSIVIHPDELHDGEALTPEGFLYRMAYIPPEILQQILGGKALPFIQNGISRDPRLHAVVWALVQTMGSSVEQMEEEDLLFDLAQVLNEVAGHSNGSRKTFDYVAAERAREYILDSLEHTVTLDELAQVSGRDRWSLSRDFRCLYGTSPYRYLTMRRLDYFRRLIIVGLSLSDAAVHAGFSDQSHMTHQFTKTYGITPARWLKTLGLELHQYTQSR